MFYLPLTASPIGWVILGVGGYALYRAGKKKRTGRGCRLPDHPPPDSENKAKTKTTA